MKHLIYCKVRIRGDWHGVHKWRLVIVGPDPENLLTEVYRAFRQELLRTEALGRPRIDPPAFWTDVVERLEDVSVIRDSP